MAHVIVEMQFEEPVASGTQAAGASRLGSCLERCGARWFRGLISGDRRRLICEYEAADAESVRVAHCTAGVPFVRVWTAELVPPQPVSATDECSSRSHAPHVAQPCYELVHLTPLEGAMPKYLIERHVPGVHEMSPEELHVAANKSCDALDYLGPDVEWQQSFITKDTINCIYIGRDEDIIRDHARISGFPADRIQVIEQEIGPATAEPRQAAAVTTT